MLNQALNEGDMEKVRKIEETREAARRMLSNWVDDPEAD